MVSDRLRDVGVAGHGKRVAVFCCDKSRGLNRIRWKTCRRYGGEESV
jgi:hypothetical protein